jgi:tetratricopeptide (TPR) repeat protein
MKTPADLPFASTKSFMAVSEMDKEGSFKGHIDISIRGDDEIFLRLSSRQMARTQWDQFSQGYSSALFYNVTTSGTVIDPPEDTSDPWHMRYEFVQSPYSEWKHFQIASLLPAVSLPAIDEKKPPKKEIELGELHTETAQSTTHLPAGYGADLPDAIHLKTAFATYDKTYQVKEGSLIGEYRLETLKKKVPAAEWKDVKKFVDDIGQEPWIQLTSTDHVMGEAGPPAAGENNPAAAKLVEEMVEAVAAKDIARATKLAGEAEALNDKQAGLWSARGYMALLRGDYSESAVAYERELLQHPEETDLYQGLLYVEVRADRKKEELEWLHKYRKVAPTNKKVTNYVAARLAMLGETAEAIAMYRDGVKALPESKLLRRNFATTLLANGKSDEGVAMMKAALEGSDDPMVLNDGAYTLADHGFELDYSENMSRKSVDLLEAETRQVSLDGANKKSIQRMNLLLGSWDTLGWIYFLEGKTELALPYLRAAWGNSYNPEEGLHLGQALEKQGDRKQAMETYELALSRLRGISGKMATDLTARIDGLEKQGLHRKSPHADSAFQDKRTFRVPRPAGLKGSAVVLFQVSATKTEHVKLVSGSDALKEREKALAALDLKLEIPKDSHALLLRSGVFFCSTGSTCELVLTPPETADVK